MNDNLARKTLPRNSPYQACGNPGNGFVGHTEPKYIGLQPGLIQMGKGQSTIGLARRAPAADDHFAQRDFGIRQSTGQRTAPVAESDEGDAGLHTGWYFKIVRHSEGVAWRKKYRARTAPTWK